MNDQLDSSTNMPALLILDLDQWRRDIKTFSDTTRDALEAIVAELSNTCVSDDSLADSLQKMVSEDAPARHVIEQKHATLSPQTDHDPPADDRLAQLKLQLARRLGR